jgi:molybdenum cofactor cytidylyltransferase
VAGVVPAAGSSSRLGRNKLLLELEGEPLVRRVARRAVEAGLSPVIVVLGFQAEAVAGALEGVPVQAVMNSRHEEGMHTSVAVGIEAVPTGCEAAIVLLPDMPLVTIPMLTEMVGRFRGSRAPLIVSLYGETQAPPTLYARPLFRTLVAAGPEGGRRVVREYAGQAVRVRWPVGLLADVDQPEDIERMRALLSRG